VAEVNQQNRRAAISPFYHCFYPVAHDGYRGLRPALIDGEHLRILQVGQLGRGQRGKIGGD